MPQISARCRRVFFVRGNCKDTRERMMARDHRRGIATKGRGDDQLGAHLLGDFARGITHNIGHAHCGRLELARARFELPTRLDRIGEARHRLGGFGIFAHGRFAREHHGVATIEDRVGDIAGFDARGSQFITARV